ncbi:MAG: glycosyltransferase [Verrucomicrobiae bacterium]|nr:glycosyltransferase [Verrucomicrobiae bacterium]
MPDPDPPIVSVVLPVRDGAQTLRPALASVLRQSLPNFELIVLDDGSTDDTPSILADCARNEPRLRLTRLPQLGLTVALNRGLELARAPYCARMDADDLAHPERLARQVAWLDAHPDVVAVGSQVTLIDDAGRPIGPLPVPLTHEEIDAAHLTGLAGRIIHPAATLRTDSLRRVGGYNPRYLTSQDYDLWLRLAETGRLANLPETLLDFRQHARSVSIQRRDQQARDVLEIWREARRRRGLDIPESLPPAQAAWLSGTERHAREWWVTLALAHGHFRTAWVHALALVRRHPTDRHVWWILHRVVRLRLRATSPGTALARLLRP